MVNIFKALADENRLRIFNILLDNELCVCEIEVMLDLSQSNASRHLTKLKNEGLISASKDAQWIHYKVDNNFLEENNFLLQFIMEKTKEEEIFINDEQRMKRYKDNELNCQLIRENRDEVLEIITLKENK